MDSYVNGVRIGRGSGNSSGNTVVGSNSLGSNSTGTANTSMGSESLMRNGSGYHNSSFGQASLHFNTTGHWNTAAGTYALYASTGTSNTGMGSRSLFWMGTGSNNTALGYAAGELQSNGTNLTSANNSIYIGANSKGDNADNNSIVIGANAIGVGANSTVIGTAATTKTRLYGTMELFNSSGTGIVLAPSTGKITLPAGAGSGIYFGTNANATLKATADGNPIFSSKVLFENGADFGTDNTLNASNVQFLRGTLANLGYRETPINATPISSIKTTGNITISRIVGSGSFQYVLGSFDGQTFIGNQLLYDWEPGYAGFLAKCDASGEVLWVKQFKSPAGYFGLSNVAINSSGNVAVVGVFSGITNSFGTDKELAST